MPTDSKSPDAERMKAHRIATNYAYDRARMRATRRLIEGHRQEFERLLEEERRRV